MKWFIKHTALSIIFVYAVLFAFLKKPYKDWDRVINSDGKGYYAYLPALFIYNDLTYGFLEDYEKKYYPQDKSVFKDYRMKHNGRIVDKYFPGLAVLWLPFFGLAHIISYLTGFPADGYSLVYQYALAFATLFYLWLGLLVLKRLLQKTGASEKVAAFITLIIALGTNITYTAMIEPTMSHVYNFTLVTGFIYFSLLAIENKQLKYYLIATVAYAMAVITRPTNGLIIMLLPFLAGSKEEFLNFIKTYYTDRKIMFFSMAVFIAVVSVLPVMWYLQTGRLFVYSYGDEGFDFTNPHIIKILFSFNRGWFVYTPVAAVSMFGFAGLIKENRFKAVSLALFLFVFIYITSSWWVWHYTSKFSQRVFVDIYAVPAMLLVYLFKTVEKKRPVKKSLVIFLSLLSVLNLFQMYQHSKWIFPASTITREIYCDSFFSLTPKARVYLPQDQIKDDKKVIIDFDDKKFANLDQIIELNGEKVCRLDSSNVYTPEYRTEFSGFFSGDNRIIKVGAEVYPEDVITGTALVIEFQADFTTYAYKSFYLKPYMKKDEKVMTEFACYVPESITESDNVKIYFFNPVANETVYVENITIDFITLAEGIDKIDGINGVVDYKDLLYSVSMDFEKDNGWSNPASITGGKAHSGVKALKIWKEMPFSTTFEFSQGYFTGKKKPFVAIHYYMFSDSVPGSARLVMELLKDDSQVDYKSFFMKGEAEQNKWTLIENLIKMPTGNAGYNKIKIYFWAPDEKVPVYIDDVRIDFYDIDF